MNWDQRSAEKVLTECSTATTALSRIVDIGTSVLSDEENRELRRKCFDLLHAINEQLVDPIHKNYPQLKPNPDDV